MQRVTVILKRLELYLKHDCVLQMLRYSHCVIFFLCLQQCIDCVLNLPLNERQCWVQAKQGVNSIKSHDNLRQKASVCFFPLKVVDRGYFLRRSENKTSN